MTEAKRKAPNAQKLAELYPAFRARISAATGIRWGLPKALAAAIDAIAAMDWKRAVKVGWDPTHVEPTGLTPSEARAGERPT
jgi:HD-like signal output (HDOD) protein